MHVYRFLLVGAWTVCLVTADSSHQQPEYVECVTKTKCHECLRTEHCSWCRQDDYNHARCNHETLLADCLPSSVYHVKSNHTRTLPIGFSIVAPIRMTVNLRIHDRHRVNIVYSQPKDYPLDLYYLIDMSYSMLAHKNELALLATSLHDRISGVTKDFRLGFGSFVDKPVMPYVSQIPPADGLSAYGYRNHLGLTQDADQFAEMVRISTVRGNVDNPEGGSDGIVQAIVCDRAIGWRNASRRLILFATDAGFHMTGDGKLGGIIAPNDGRCHLDANGEYTESTHQDYPSVSQINMLAKKHSVNIIFAVTGGNERVYKRLSERIEGSSSVVIKEDSSNIVQVVQDEYNKIRSTVEMKDNAPSFIHVDYYSNCNTAIRTKTNKCQHLQNGERVSFEVVFTATECPQLKDDWKQLVRIYPVGFRNQSTQVEIHLLCECDCERLNGTADTANCNSRGSQRCGLCECDPGYLGKKCECSADGAQSQTTQEHVACIKPSDIIECSGRGSCVCGECKCDERPNRSESFSGPFCECDNFSCERRDGRLCSGNGVCTCGNCVCHRGHTGPACDCSQAHDQCLANGEICSGHGRCKCNTCECDDRHFGGQCQHCPSCPGHCNDAKDCVMCRMYRKGPLAETAELCTSNCSHIQFKEVVDFDDVDTTEDRPCVYYEDACKFQFLYRSSESDGHTTEVIAQREMDCPSALDAVIIVVSVMAAILLFGNAMLFGWKLLTTLHDRREFSRFQKECVMSSWDAGNNPLFKNPTSTFMNPAFGRQSVPAKTKDC